MLTGNQNDRDNGYDEKVSFSSEILAFTAADQINTALDYMLDTIDDLLTAGQFEAADALLEECTHSEVIQDATLAVGLCMVSRPRPEHIHLLPHRKAMVAKAHDIHGELIRGF